MKYLQTRPVALAAAALAAAFLLPLPAAHATDATQPAVAVKTYAQELVDRVVAHYPDIRAVVIHAAPAKGAANIVIASNIGRIGKPADDADLDVVSTGRTRIGMDRGNKRVEVELPLRDVGGEIVGALALAWRFPVGGNKAEFQRTAQAIRDGLARRILNAANLVDPYPYERLSTTKSRAQTIVDEALLRHPEVTVLALRGRAQGGELVVLGSTFGRHGKKADADDLKVLQSAEPIPGVYSNGRRFGVDMPVHGKGGGVIGTMNVGYALKTGEDTKEMLREAIALRGELEREIAATPDLAEVDP